MIGLAFVAALVAAFFVTGAVRRYALQSRLVDVPNARSSHSTPTPRGGGVAFVAAFLALLCGFGAAGLVSPGALAAFAGSGLAVAAIGFADDHRHVPARYRLAVHTLAAVWLVYWLGASPAPVLADLGLPPVEWLAVFVAVVATVWLVNLYNFMDGIDALAAVEAITVCLAAAFVYVTAPGEPPSWHEPLLLASAVAGFAVWNLPPARIFMGDVGSGFLGAVLAALALQAIAAEPALFWVWSTLLGVFVVDATVTLLRRLARGAKVYEAHRGHAYQHAARRFGHTRVVLAVAAVNGLWLLPIAYLIAQHAIAGPWGTAAAYLPMIGVAIALRAGQEA
jgi:Fuc2NAc and GlcNAc transferase